MEYDDSITSILGEFVNTTLHTLEATLNGTKQSFLQALLLAFRLLLDVFDDGSDELNNGDQ